MIDAIAFVFVFRSRTSHLFNWGFASKSILYPIQRRGAFVTREDLKEGSPLAVSRNILQHLYRIKLLRPQNDLKMYAKSVTIFSGLFSS